MATDPAPHPQEDPTLKDPTLKDPALKDPALKDPTQGDFPSGEATLRPAPVSTRGRSSNKRIVSQDGNTDVTRAGMIWVAVSSGLVVLVLLIIFILQNQDRVSVKYFGIVGELSLGMALFIAAVAGGIVVAVAGAVRILQLRHQRRRQRNLDQNPLTEPATSTGKATD
ncbi:lipopolysaccharide assembly protein LapA domain-containing protein [Arthrobacter sp. TMP15]|uniref:LapA family protein n=1 Tax=Arthrobacter sp. TMP15 TaxID=3140789 RepID=UPI0031BA2659